MYKFFMKLIVLVFALIFAGAFIRPVGGEDKIAENVEAETKSVVWELVTEEPVTEEPVTEDPEQEVTGKFKEQTDTKEVEDVKQELPEPESVEVEPIEPELAEEIETKPTDTPIVVVPSDYEAIFLSGFNSLRVEHGLEPIDSFLEQGLMEGALQWCDTMIENKRVSHSNYTWMRPYRSFTDGYTSIVEGVDFTEDLTYEAIYSVGRRMCSHIGLNKSSVSVRCIGIGIREGLHIADNAYGSDVVGNNGLYICVGAIVKEEK